MGWEEGTMGTVSSPGAAFLNSPLLKKLRMLPLPVSAFLAGGIVLCNGIPAHRFIYCGVMEADASSNAWVPSAHLPIIGTQSSNVRARGHGPWLGSQFAMKVFNELFDGGLGEVGRPSNGLIGGCR